MGVNILLAIQFMIDVIVGRKHVNLWILIAIRRNFHKEKCAAV